MDLKKKFDELPEARNGGDQKRENHLINPKELQVAPFQGDAMKFNYFIEDTKGFLDIIRPELCPLVEWLEFQPELVDMLSAEATMVQKQRSSERVPELA